jgi:hypothetical protein
MRTVLGGGVSFFITIVAACLTSTAFLEQDERRSNLESFKEGDAPWRPKMGRRPGMTWDC